MTKEEMRKEIKFPILAPRAIEFMPIIKELNPNYPLFEDLYNNIPIADSWIIAVVDLGNNVRKFFGIYKWQKENNPENIIGWSYINLEASTGLARYVEYEHLSDPNIILVVDEKQKDYIIKFD